jgi:long-chain acyl-CoA synthetase
MELKDFENQSIQGHNATVMGSFADHFFSTARKFASLEAFSFYLDGKRVSFSYLQFEKAVLLCAQILISRGINQQSRVALILGNDFDFILAFYALGSIGASVIPLDSRAQDNELGELLNQARVDYLVSSQSSLKLAQAAFLKSHSEAQLIDLTGVGMRALNEEPQLLASDLSTGWKLTSPALIVFTSGTTGNPKGAVITWGNLAFQIESVGPIVQREGLQRILSILPLNHLFGLVAGVLIPYGTAMATTFASTFLPHEILERMQKNRPTEMVVVPLFLKSLERGLQAEIRKKLAARIYFQLASLLARLFPNRGIRRFLFAPILKKFGGIERFFSGGAPLPVSSQKFYERMGIEVSQGYGLTETSPIITANRTGQSRYGSVGPAIPGVEVRIDSETGEILTRGPHVMSGYENRMDLNAEILKDGWFRTGDIGSLSSDGYLTISGRLKEMIVLACGKKVFPDEVEEAVSHLTEVADISVFGIQEVSAFQSETEVVCAVVVPVTKDPAEAELVREKVRQAFLRLSPYKRPSKILLTNAELQKTTTKKNKRLLIRRLILQKEIRTW